MIPPNPMEHLNAVKTLYASCMGKVCSKHKITRMELDILLFLANNPRYDTAAEIIEIRYLSKSQVSASIKCLEKNGYIEKIYADRNRKTAHLKICEAASNIIQDGRNAQENFLAIMLNGFSWKEMDAMKRFNDKIRDNINTYLKEREPNHV